MSATTVLISHAEATIELPGSMVVVQIRLPEELASTHFGV